MAKEGFYLSIVLIIGFMSFASASLYMVSQNQITPEMLEKLYANLGTLATMFGIPGIITAYVITRGKTSNGST